MPAPELVWELQEHFCQDGYRRLFELSRQKWESLGRIGGSVRLKEASEEERRRISGLMGSAFPKGGTIEVKLADLDQRLRETRWSVSLEELLSILDGRPLISNRQKRERHVSEWNSFCEKLLAKCNREETKRWWGSIRSGESLGAKAVKQLFDHQPASAERQAELCLSALEELPCWKQSFERLPVFANRLSGNPHEFDADTPSGRLLYQALCDVFGVEAGSASEWKREVLQEAGIYMDEAASYVMALGIKTTADDPWLPYCEQSARARVPMLLPLALIQQRLAWQQIDRLFVVENPSIFHSVIDRWPRNCDLPPLICTSGQPSVAALRLLDTFASKGSLIFYSGDFDWKGIEITCALRKRYGDALVPWRMGVEEYLAHQSAVFMGEDHLQGLLALEVSWDEQLVKTMRQRKRKAFQESLFEVLFADLAALGSAAE